MSLKEQVSVGHLLKPRRVAASAVIEVEVVLVINAKSRFSNVSSVCISSQIIGSISLSTSTACELASGVAASARLVLATTCRRCLIFRIRYAAFIGAFWIPRSLFFHFVSVYDRHLLSCFEDISAFLKF
jgi:hypothetical protein